MNRSILLGIDAYFSPPTRRALHIAGELFEASSPDARLLVLHVIPVPLDPASYKGKLIPEGRSFLPTSQQRLQAEHALWQARTALLKRGIPAERIVRVIRWGVPAEEIAKAARQMGVERIILGSHANTLLHSLQRLLIGSTSSRVRQLSPCPVTIIPSSQATGSAMGLVGWYRESV